MDDAADIAKEHLEQVAEGHHHGGGKTWVRRAAAVLIAILGSIGTMTEMQATDAQTAYLSHLLRWSDNYNQYQAKSIRRLEHLNAAEIESHLAGNDVQTLNDIEKHKKEAARMMDDGIKNDGMTQLAAQAETEAEARDRSEHAHHGYERGFRYVSLALIFVGLSLAVDLMPLTIAAIVVGIAVGGYVLTMDISLF